MTTVELQDNYLNEYYTVLTQLSNLDLSVGDLFVSKFADAVGYGEVIYVDKLDFHVYWMQNSKKYVIKYSFDDSSPNFEYGRGTQVLYYNTIIKDKNEQLVWKIKL